MRHFSTRLIFAVMAALCAMISCGPPERQVRVLLREGTAPWRPESNIGPMSKNSSMLMWEVTKFANVNEPTDEQRLAASDLIERSYAAAEKHRWYDFAAGKADGFKLMHLDEVHFVNKEFLFDDALLDPERPEFLMYYNTPQGRVLAGVMYYVREPLERGPQIGGPLTLWHYHTWSEAYCFEKDMLIVGRTYGGDSCSRGKASYRSPEMIHVWLLDHARGPFASSMMIDREELPSLLEKRRRGRSW